jgi:hypothetical protein
LETDPLSRDEPLLLLRPTLACALAHAGLTPGVSQALWTQQLHYWIEVHRKAGRAKTHRHDGRWWTWNSLASWQAQFPFWSRATTERVIARSVQAGVTLTGNYNRAGYDRTLWYTIDYERLKELVRAWERSRPSPHIEEIDALNLQECISSECGNGDRQPEGIDSPNLRECISSDCGNGDRQSEEIDPRSLREPIPEITKEYTEKERQRIWSRSCKELAMQMTWATFSTWIRPLRLERVARAPSGRDGAGTESACQVVLRCPTPYVQDWCQHRLHVRIRDVLAGALDVQVDDLDVQYVLEASGETIDLGRN